MAFVKDHLKIKNTVLSVILYLSDCITSNLSAYLKPKILLRSMPTTDFPLATLFEKRRHPIFEDKHLGCIFQSSFRHPITHLLPCDLCDVLPGWGLTDTSIIHLMKLSKSVFMNSVC